MSEDIAQLKSDIAVLERVGREGGYANGYAVDPLLEQMKCKLERLEEEARDPHKEAKDLVSVWDLYSDQKSDLRKVANYVKFLKHEIHLVIRERDQLRKWVVMAIEPGIRQSNSTSLTTKAQGACVRFPTMTK